MDRPTDFAERVAAIMMCGLRCRVVCSQDGGFPRLDLQPLPDWIHLADDATVADFHDKGWHYHVSLSTWPVDGDAWSRIVERWHSTEVVVQIQYINDNGGAVPAWEGLGADPDMWELYMSGSYGYKWRDSHYGLHISM